VHMLAPDFARKQPTIPDLVKLNTNENPYGPSPCAFAAIAGEVTNALGLYPDPTVNRLRTVIAQGYGLDANNIFVGNGSDEVLAHTFQALLKHNAPLFSGYHLQLLSGLLPALGDRFSRDAAGRCDAGPGFRL
jgi:histidinol-phosphate aminotransferase